MSTIQATSPEMYPSRPILISLAYANKDKRYLEKLEQILKTLRLQEMSMSIASHSMEVTKGEDYERTNILDTADVILLLVSPDFVASEFCYSRAMRQAVERHKRGEARIIPIILRPSIWEKTPWANLDPLPTNGTPVTSWSKHDAAFQNIATGIRGTLKELSDTLLFSLRSDELKHEESDSFIPPPSKRKQPTSRKQAPKENLPDQTSPKSAEEAALQPQTPTSPNTTRSYLANTPSDVDEIKILFIAANPISMTRLQLDEEIRAITEKIRASKHRDVLKLEHIWAARPDDLLQSLNEHQPQIVHFSGHGSRVGEIKLVDNNSGEPKAVSTRALKALFTTLKDNIQVVLLNACYSRVQAEAFTEVIDCVIGMNDAIGDQAAIIFAASFYRAIGFGRSIQEAFDQGKAALLLEGIPEENTPELLLKTGIDPCKRFLIKKLVNDEAEGIPRAVGEYQERVGNSNTSFADFLSENEFVQDVEAMLADIQSLTERKYELFDKNICFIAIEIDDCSGVANKYGDIASNNLIWSVGLRIKSQLRIFPNKHSRLYHIRVDRFYLLIEDMLPEEAQPRAEKLRQILDGDYRIEMVRPMERRLPPLHSDSLMPLSGVTVHIGVVWSTSSKLREIMQQYPVESSKVDVRELIAHILDEVLNIGQYEGGNVVISWDPNIQNFIRWARFS